MRRKDREVLDLQELLSMLDSCDTVHLALNREGAPYVLPMSFGWEQLADGTTALYVHGAREGLKLELAQRDNRVGVALDRFDGYDRTAHGITTRYRSVLARGEIRMLAGEEALHGLRLICAHCGYEDFEVEAAVLQRTSVWQILLSDMTGKKNVR